MRATLTIIFSLLSGCGLVPSPPPGMAQAEPRVAMLAADLAPRLAAAKTPVVNGPGPIGVVNLAMSESRSADNPRGWNLYWLHKGGLKVGDPDYRQKFRVNLLAQADWIIDFCAKHDIKRLLVWDIEGQELDHWESYVGDPRILPPEMAWSDIKPGMTHWEAIVVESTAQLYFRKFREAGINVGGTLRPTVLRTKPYGSNRLRDQADKSYGWEQAYTADPRSVLSGKIGYCAGKFGWTEVYFDSSVHEWAWVKHADPAPYPIAFYRYFLEKYPQVCIHPEFGPTDGTLPNVQPWVNWTADTPAPKVLSALAMNPYSIDPDQPGVRNKLLALARRGHDFMVSVDQPLAVDVVARQVATWRMGAGR